MKAHTIYTKIWQQGLACFDNVFKLSSLEMEIFFECVDSSVESSLGTKCIFFNLVERWMTPVENIDKLLFLEVVLILIK